MSVRLIARIKILLRWIREKVRGFFLWIWGECRDWRTVLLLLAVAAFVYSPVWVGYLLHLLFDWHWALVMATAVLVFWVGPFTPFIPICVALTLAIKKWHELRKQKKGNRKSN